MDLGKEIKVENGLLLQRRWTERAPLRRWFLREDLKQEQEPCQAVSGKNVHSKQRNSRRKQRCTGCVLETPTWQTILE